MDTKRLTAKKYQHGYFIYYTGTSRLVATYRKIYVDHYGTIEFNNGKTIFPVNSLAAAKKAIINNLDMTN